MFLRHPKNLIISIVFMHMTFFWLLPPCKNGNKSDGVQDLDPFTDPGPLVWI